MGRAIGGLFLSLFVFGCAGSGVKRDYDESFDFKSVKSYGWRSTSGSGDSSAGNSLVDARVRNAVNAVLLGKGYKNEPLDRADFLIDYRYTVERDAAADSSGAGVGMGMGSGGFFGSLGLSLGGGRRSDETEILTIDALSPRDEKLVWRGFTRRRLERSSDPKKSAVRMHEMVSAILSEFPPKKKK